MVTYFRYKGYYINSIPSKQEVKVRELVLNKDLTIQYFTTIFCQQGLETLFNGEVDFSDLYHISTNNKHIYLDKINDLLIGYAVNQDKRLFVIDNPFNVVGCIKDFIAGKKIEKKDNILCYDYYWSLHDICDYILDTEFNIEIKSNDQVILTFENPAQDSVYRSYYDAKRFFLQETMYDTLCTYNTALNSRQVMTYLSKIWCQVKEWVGTEDK